MPKKAPTELHEIVKVFDRVEAEVKRNGKLLEETGKILKSNDREIKKLSMFCKKTFL